MIVVSDSISSTGPVVSSTRLPGVVVVVVFSPVVPGAVVVGVFSPVVPGVVVAVVFSPAVPGVVVVVVVVVFPLVPEVAFVTAFPIFWLGFEAHIKKR